MMQLKAKCDLWIAITWEYGNPIIDAKKGDKFPVGLTRPHEGWGRIIQLEQGDSLSFKAIADGSDPYAQLATRYPEWFEIEELNK